MTGHLRRNTQDAAKRGGKTLKAVSSELREHDRRITRLEAKWEAAMEFAALRFGNSKPPQIERSGSQFERALKIKRAE